MKATSISVRQFNRKLRNMAKESPKAAERLAKRSAIWFVQSVIKLTKPGTGKSVKNLPAKFKNRPIEKRPDGKFWCWDAKQSDPEKPMWLVDKMPRGATRRGFVKISKGVKWWNKKTNSFDYLPATDENISKWKVIRYAGAAKGAWNKIISQLGKSSERGNKHGEAKRIQTSGGAKYFLHNMIQYVSKICEVNQALALTMNRLEGFKKHAKQEVVNAYK